jgi:hypothetical protein
MDKKLKAPLLGYPKKVYKFKVVHSDMKKYYVVEEIEDKIICFTGSFVTAKKLADSLNEISHMDDDLDDNDESIH